MTKEIKIKYTQLDKKSYETDTRGLNFEVTINGVTGRGTWEPTMQFNKSGMDVNQLLVDGRYVQIFKSGGSYRAYEIFAYPDIAPKQPKNLWMTGRTLLTTTFKSTFISKIQKALANPEQKAKLSELFLQTFKLTGCQQALTGD